jgi:hypothetical protein
MLEDGTALSYLEQTCPRQHFAVCTDLNELKSYNSLHPYPEGSLDDYFLWGGPLAKLGGFTGEEAEAGAIVRGTLSMYAPAQFRASVIDGWRQFSLFSTGREITPVPDEHWVATAILGRFGPAVYEKYRHSEQIRNNLDFSFISRVDTVVVAASSLLLVGFLIIPRAKNQPRSFYATIMMSMNGLSR